MNGDTMESSTIRSRRNNDLDENGFGTCDCTSYCYFALAVILFTVGTIITVLALDEGSGNMFSSMGHMWLVGPIFISSGLMVAVKTVLYLRKKSLMTLILRQRALLRELQGLQANQQMMRNPSILTLPPAYDVVVSQPDSCRPTSDNLLDNNGSRCGTYLTPLNGMCHDEPPPPTYEEAILLGLQSVNRSIIMPSEQVNHTGNSKDSMA